jgi:integrase
MTFTELSRDYLASGCRDKAGMPRQAHQQAHEKTRIGFLKTHFRSIPVDKISVRSCADYGLKNPDRQRAADIDLQTLSNMLWYAVMEGHLKANPVIGRAKHRKSAAVRHCRESMPASGDVVHRLAREMFATPASESAGWQLLFEAYTGCRTSEMLSLRTDAAAKNVPGFVEGQYLYVRRQKKGRNQFIQIDADLRELMDAHARWKALRYPDSPWYFPGISIALPLSRRTLTQRLGVVCKDLGLPHVTSHGLRAFHVTVRRSRGESDSQVAAAIGNQTVALVQNVYGDLPMSWSGGESLSFAPKSGPKAWEVVRVQEAA